MHCCQEFIMPKRKSTKTNSSASKEEAKPNKPAILRVVKQNNTSIDDNNSAQPESALTALPTENQPVEPELEINNNQSKSIKVSEPNSSSIITDDAVPQTIIDNEQSDLSQTLLAVAAKRAESTAKSENTSDEDGELEINSEQPQLEEKPAYKKLSTATNRDGQTFAVKEKIEVTTGNFGIQKVFIISLYEAPDGSVWAYYHPVDKNQRLLWKRGCCRIENLRKLDSNSCPA